MGKLPLRDFQRLAHHRRTRDTLARRSRNERLDPIATERARVMNDDVYAAAVAVVANWKTQIQRL